MALVYAFGNPVYDEIITPAIATEGRVLSGCSTNACLALTRLGHATHLVGRIGSDYHDRFAADMNHFGVSATTTLSPQTGGFRLVYDRRGDRTLDVLGVAEHIEEIPAGCSQADAVIIGPILQETATELIARIAQRCQAPLFVDPQGLLRRIGPDQRIEHFLPAEFAAIARVSLVVKANEVETKVITGVDPREEPRDAVRRLKALGCEIAIVTLAEAGSWIDDGIRQYQIPAYTTDARDPTGAGDTYLAGFIYAYLANPQDLFRAGCVGAATASIWIEHTGPEAPITLSEVERRAAELIARDGN